jgi:hypothetical protein
MCSTDKGTTRKYRKSLKRLGASFPCKGVFHLTRNGNVVEPADSMMTDEVVFGPAPSSPQEETPNHGDLQSVQGIATIVSEPTPELITVTPHPNEATTSNGPPDAQIVDGITVHLAPSPDTQPEQKGPAVTSETLPPEFREIEGKINVLLRERGFGERIQHADWTGWPRKSEFWRRLSFYGELWCQTYQRDSIAFGVDANLLRAAVAWALSQNGSLDEFLELARNNPDFPDTIQQIQTTFHKKGRDYWGVQLGPACGIMEIRAVIAELVNAFVIYMEGGKPWSPIRHGGGKKAEPGVLWKQTVRMPDADAAPHHGFTLLEQKITRLLQRHGYKHEPILGSHSWVDNSKTRFFKLCFYGDWEWRFGVRGELLQANARVRALFFDHRFHVPPDTGAVFHGFLVFDTEESWQRVRDVIACL